MRVSIRVLPVMLLLATVGSSTAQVVTSGVEHTESVFTAEALAKRWRLSTEEWAQYQTLMAGPRGIWSPNLDPVTVLGIDAETEAERRRYAELLVMLEYERVEKELRFQRAYDEAAQRLFPTLPRVTTAAAEASDSPAVGAERIAFVGSIDPKRCPTCERALKELMRAHRASHTAALDLFLADAADDEAIRAWAKQHGVDADEVRVGRITLNHAQGPWSLPGAGEPITPRVLARSAGQWWPMLTPTK